MIRNIRLCIFVALVGLCSGCAHTILIGPDLNQMPSEQKVTSNRSVGYYISAEDRALKVTTAGGGGDSVEYTPYKDLEAALYRVLSNHFAQVYALKSVDDRAFINDKKISFIFSPHFSTTSSSGSLLTWPPTEFSLTIFVKGVDQENKVVWESQVVGVGHAEFSEFKHDFGLAAERASTDAFLKLQSKLAEIP